MFWVTSRLVHFDRVASAWLISRFIDPEARFEFIDPAGTFPEGATTFGLAGGDIGRHDADGTTFRKLLHKYGVSDPALGELDKIVAAGVAYVMQGVMPSPNDRCTLIAIGLLAVGEGNLILESSDHDILDRSFPLWDAIYVDASMHLLRHAPAASESDPAARQATRFNMAIARARHVVGRARKRAALESSA